MHRPSTLGKVGVDVKHACVTAEHVRADLLASGWTAPWQGWGHWEEVAEQTAKNLREHAPPGGNMYPPLLPPPKASFWRRADDEGDRRDRLPQGEVFATGDFADSCVTGIRVTPGPYERITAVTPCAPTESLLESIDAQRFHGHVMSLRMFRYSRVNQRAGKHDAGSGVNGTVGDDGCQGCSVDLENHLSGSPKHAIVMEC